MVRCAGKMNQPNRKEALELLRTFRQAWNGQRREHRVSLPRAKPKE
jgi:hypothetical protein